MAPIHAHYVSADSVSATIGDTSRPVSAEQIDALGWKTMFLDGSGDGLVKAAQSQAQELGYPVTQEGCAVGFNLEPDKNATKFTTELAALLTKINIQQTGEDIDLCTTKDTLVVITDGSPGPPYLTLKDVHHFPAGAKFRLIFDENNSKVAATAFFKEIDNDPIRHAYLNTQAHG
ncbi:hypothetical protein BDP27DRAFT_1356155 [Rhodocollybia butyracea]|uniref:Uncharacterized protein n=1 Tax=Rhodocollybia butyracea TaxID=206335 RepID=A0A9P5TVI3_9AGAR|nr:hypothetical protein BDP27DRAFT_1356155 [Rhodocollybia butyracea]